MRWKVGDVMSIKVCKDRWLPIPHSFRTTTRIFFFYSDMLVSKLINV